jgi:hypothetical protein
MGLVDEEALVRALAQQLQLPVVKLEGKRVQQELLDLVPADFAEKHLCVPLFSKEVNGVETLHVGMEDPCNLPAIDDLGFRTGLRIQPVLVSPSELCEAIDRFYHRSQAAPTVGASSPRPSAGAPATPIEAAALVEAAAPIEESLFQEISALGGDAAEDDTEPEIPDDFGPLLENEAGPDVRAQPAPESQAAVEFASEPVEATNRTILRALCELLIEKGVITRQELVARVRSLQGG